MVWVIISHGTTQWARWLANTGDPKEKENRPPPPEPDRSFARGDLGLCQAERGDGKNRLESWQDDIPLPRILLKKDRNWAILPCTSDPDKPWLLHFALEILRHENLHDPTDGSMNFLSFYKHMTRKAWSHNMDACKKVCRSPLHLLQSLIYSTPSPTFAAVWWFQPHPLQT